MKKQQVKKEKEKEQKTVQEVKWLEKKSRKRNFG